MTTEWMQEENKYVLPTYEKFPFALVKGEGNYVWDEAGNKYLDLYGGHAVALLGHCPKEVADAVSTQARQLLFYSNLVYTPSRASAAKALVELCGEPGSQVFFCNSGAEANENAMRVARAVTARPTIVATEGSFHGRTAAALAATGIAKYRKGVAGLGTDIVHIPFNDLSAAAAAIGKNTAGVILEPIQSVAGVIPASKDYLRGLERLCQEKAALLIFDEVQTGLGRVGAPTAAQAYGVHPQILTFAKAIGSGIPAAATLITGDIASKVKQGELGSTFGGGPVACAAMEATLRAIQNQKLWENAARLEAIIRKTFNFPGIKEIRGKGLLLAIVLDGPSKPARQALLERNILVGGADDPNVIRLLPPLTISENDVAVLRDALQEILASQVLTAAH
jgi:acetylornithine/succinyldiaminopimelate/putrescine aminotransferase